MEGLVLPRGPEGRTRVKKIFSRVDTSTSMAGEQDDLAKGVNDLLTKILAQKTKDQQIQVSIDVFNHQMSPLVEPFMLTHDFPRLNPNVFNMDGDTALYDAVGKSVDALCVLAHTDTRMSDIVFVVGTDGRDTVSKEFDAAAVRKVVDDYKQKGVSFVYIAAGEGAYEAGVEMGFTTKECKRVAETDSIGSHLASQLVEEAISQALFLAPPKGGEEQSYPPEFDASSPKRIKIEEVSDEVYSQYF